MIITAKLHDAADALAHHLLRTDVNEKVQVRTVGLCASGLFEGFREMRSFTAHCTVKKGHVHVSASPSEFYTRAQWDEFWRRFEREFGNVGAPYISVIHWKLGPGGRYAAHEHRLYLWITPEGRLIDKSFIAVRCQKLARIAEVKNGEQLTSGRHNRVVIEYLRREGETEGADAMVKAGLDVAPRPIADSAADRAESERRQDMSATEIFRLAYLAWAASTDGQSLERALRGNGLHLCQGRDGPGVTTSRGTFKLLSRAVGNGARKHGARVLKDEVLARLEGLQLLPLEIVRPALSDPEPIGPLGIPGLDRPDRAAAPEPPLQSEEYASDIADAPPLVPELNDLPYEQIAVPTPIRSGSPTLSPTERVKQDIERVARMIGPDGAAHLDALMASMDVAATECVASDLFSEEDMSLPPLREGNDEMRQPSDPPPERANGHGRRPRQKHRGDVPLPPDTRQNRPVRKRSADRPIAIRADADAYKAKLANLTDDFGALIRWVERDHPDGRRVELRSGTTLFLRPEMATADRATMDTVALLVDHALREGWEAMELHGGTPEWQEGVARAAIKAGIEIVKLDLQTVSEAAEARSAPEDDDVSIGFSRYR